MVALASCLLPSRIFAADKPVNIIHIVGDDVGYDDLSCYGAPKIKTPNIDKLATHGMKFTNFYAPSAICTPTRAALMTGCYAQRVGLQRVLFPNDNIGINKNEVTIADLLKKQGYATALIGKWHLGHHDADRPTAHGFDYFYGTVYPNDHGPERKHSNHQTEPFPPIPVYRNNEIVEQPAKLAECPDNFAADAIKWITEHKDQPFFLHYSNIETHTPWYVPKRFEDKSGDTAYGDAVECLDWQVGQLMETLDKLGLAENTLVVFTTDNGPLWQHHPELEQIYGKYGTVDTTRPHLLRAGKYNPRWEGGARVPMIVRWPGKVAAGATSDGLAAGFDLYTTFASVAGAQIPTDRIIDGKDLTPLLTGKTEKSPRDTFYYYGQFKLAAVRQGDYKLVLPGNPGPHEKETVLYDVKNDPGETKELSKDHPEIVAKLQKIVAEAREDLGDGPKNKGKNRRPNSQGDQE
jgi:arylsulfatase A-like enzyme